MDSLELIDQDYVLVSGPPIDTSYSSTSGSKPSHFPYKSQSPSKASLVTMSSAPMPITGAANSNICHIGSLESRSSAPGTSQGSVDVVDTLEQPSKHCMTRINSLQKCASAITELVNEKVYHDMPTTGCLLVQAHLKHNISLNEQIQAAGGWFGSLYFDSRTSLGWKPLTSACESI